MKQHFESVAAFRQVLETIQGPDSSAMREAEERNGQLTKPYRALGRLDEIAVWYSAWQRTPVPSVSFPWVTVFAGNHGVARRGVSAYPSEVTAQMVENFRQGGAAINQICQAVGARFQVVALDLDRPTADFTVEPAMSEAEFTAALTIGWDSFEPACDTLVVGEMGIGNTTAASAVAAGLFGGPPSRWVGSGTGVDAVGLDVKRQVVEDGLRMHRSVFGDPLEIARCLGGREFAAMIGAILRARVESVPVLLDGFICTAAAAVLERAKPGALDHCLAGHLSAERAHGRILEAIGKKPLLSLDMRLGEATGGALAIPIVRAALQCQSGMSTFADAAVSGRDDAGDDSGSGSR
ncbi:MAG: nicotinate-nucleotide--dimethylbenzimidazole phosphoribosyltransferase [Paracoccaceae bacterium]|nr:nicotinate-nucleotide--dimethylbenzimidazole phosphoribosyltransferase [Paracoccaceae bacterium]MDE2915405.1 nicotinate-nucleotide--dimethylbenzimidazole phosphoribosyltransferase [Paracoccaceae bacterium]